MVNVQEIIGRLVLEKEQEQEKVKTLLSLIHGLKEGTFHRDDLEMIEGGVRLVNPEERAKRNAARLLRMAEDSLGPVAPLGVPA